MAIQAVVQTGVSGYAPTSWGNIRNLGRKSNGELWCAYSRNIATNSHRTCVAYSRDNGLTWTEDKVFTELGTTYSNNPSTYPTLAIDGLDNVHVAWTDVHGPNSDGWGSVVYFERTSAGWSDPVWITDDERSDGAFIAIATDSNDDVHLVWQRSPVQLGPRQIFYCKRASGTWGSLEAVTDKTEHQEWPSIAIDSNDDVHVVWAGLDWGTNTAYYNIQYRKRTTTWQTQEAITDIAGNQAIATIAIDSSDQPHVTWHGVGWGTNTTKRSIQYRMRTTSWQSQEELVNVAYDQYQPCIAIDGSDNIHCVWYGLGWGTNTAWANIQYKKRDTSWGSQVAITDRDHHQYHPTLIWAVHPVAGGGQQCNRPDDGYAFVWFVDNDPTFQVEFYSSSDLSWDYIQLLVKYASGQAKEVFT